jgi:hypothetical protein
MRLDVRLPAGVMLAAIGVLLAGYGVLGDPSIYRRSLGINVNLVWGIVLALAGAGLLALASKKDTP